MQLPPKNTTSDLFDPAALVYEVCNALQEVAALDSLWPNGVVHRGGPHYRLNGTLGPVSFGEDECVSIGRFVNEFRPSNCFIIGNAFGMSSVYIAKAMEACGGSSVITLDNKSEGDGERCATVAEKLRERMQAHLLENRYGWSPNDILSTTEGKKFDFLLIDGLHAHPQVTDDYHGALNVLHDQSIICWHDYWLAGVPESVATAESEGFLCTKVNTSGELVFGTRDKSVFDRIQATFPEAEAPRKRTRVMGYARLYMGLFRAAARRRLGIS